MTTTDTPDGRYTSKVSPTPTAETILVNFRSESQQPHELIFARLGEGYTVDEAVKLRARRIDHRGDSHVRSPRRESRRDNNQVSHRGIADVTKPLDPAIT